MEADCRLCKRFVPVSKMSEELKEEAWIWIMKHRPGKDLKGWCNYYNRPCTHYTGSCPAFLPKRQTNGNLTLDMFMGVKDDDS
ncbi:MAG: hypothetical protein ACXQTI_10655 [Candidatus Nezhaarchaeales archaeon]